MALRFVCNLLFILCLPIFVQATELRFVGIGVTIEKIRGNKFRVSELRPNAPAETAGILRGDLITKIDGTETRKMKLDHVVKQIGDGPVDSVVILSLAARSESLPARDVSVTRKEIVVDCLMYGVLNLTYSGSESSGRVSGTIGSDFLNLNVMGNFASGIFKGQPINLQRFDSISPSSVSFRGYFRGSYLSWYANSGYIHGFQGCIE